MTNLVKTVFFPERDPHIQQKLPLNKKNKRRITTRLMSEIFVNYEQNLYKNNMLNPKKNYNYAMTLLSCSALQNFSDLQN